MNVTTSERYATDEDRWQAVLSRDAAADGAFYYAVRSTGVYCRPSCPARRPSREQVLFFDSADAAARGGFRACRRCRPAEVDRQRLVVARVQRLLEEAEDRPTLTQLAGAVGVSPHHLQRVFKRVT